MKKIIIPALSLLILSGCGTTEQNFSSSITDGQNTAITIDGIHVTNDDIYHYLLETQGANTIIAEALTFIADKEITDQAQIDELVNQQITDYEAYTQQTIDEYATSLGYENKDAYLNDVIIPSVKNELLVEKYVGEHYDQLVKDTSVKYIKTITVANESDAMAIIDQSVDTTTFDTLFTENSGVDVGFVSNESTSVDENIIKNLTNFTADGLYSKAIATSTGEYAVVYVYNTDLSTVKEDVTENLTMLSSTSVVANAYYLEMYEFKVYEAEIKDQIESATPEYIG